MYVAESFAFSRYSKLEAGVCCCGPLIVTSSVTEVGGIAVSASAVKVKFHWRSLSIFHSFISTPISDTFYMIDSLTYIL